MNTQRKLEVIAPRQSNYDTYFLPEQVADLEKSTPLYRLVAFWGLRLQSYVCRDDVALAFGISLRQASGLISAIARKHEEIICHRKRIKMGSGNVIKSYIFIHDVLHKQPKKREYFKAPNLPRKVKEKQFQARSKLIWAELLTNAQLGLHLPHRGTTQKDMLEKKPMIQSKMEVMA